MPRLNMRLTLQLIFLLSISLLSQNENIVSDRPTLTVAKIMQDPLHWIGSLPHRDGIFWSDDGQWVYFMWNPEKAKSDSLYKISRNGGTPQKVSLNERKTMPSANGHFTKDRKQKVYEKNGDIFLLDVKSGNIRQITSTSATESMPHFTHDEQGVTFISGNNLYRWQLSNGTITQLTDFQSGTAPLKKEEPKTAHEKWLKREETSLIEILRRRSEKAELAKTRREKEKPQRPQKIYVGDKQVEAQQLSPDQRYITFRLYQDAKDAQNTIVPNYITETGYTEDLSARPKVGHPQMQYEFGIYDTQVDTVYYANPENIPGIYDEPVYLGKAKKKVEAEENDEKGEKDKEARDVVIYGPYWSENGNHAMVVVRAWDNKDRWMMLLDPASGKLTNLDRQHDEAWIGGPGISGWVFNAGNVGWMPDNRRVWFHSEESGYSHLYTVDVFNKGKKALTSGKFEVINAQISRDKKQWYLTTSEAHPGEHHLYKMPLNGGTRTQITKMVGKNEIYLSPDEKMIAIRHSYSNKPWQLYLMENKPGATLRQITDDLTDDFKAYPWRDPQLVTFTARDGAEVYARLYRPKAPEKRGPAVIFVHGAGYLQNVHKWWSSYFREYMFHNLLADNGYTVLDIDYRASAGYGRDWRTAIYRHMGGKDLSDQVDGVKYLIENFDIDPERIGIYGGSYGGFITFMAMFTEPDVFACGAALRPVTDWAHYNHPYTSNILNEPQLDSLAYVRSSPIYHAEGLKGPLLICHGMIDTNVHFQDVVRLTQRLIELGKENWEVAIYPLEGHGFKEPSSWTDEYRRIFKLFEENLK